MTEQPHDSMFKYAFSAPERAAEELRAVLPSEIVAEIDWSTLKLESGDFIDEELRRQSTDLLLRWCELVAEVGAAPHGIDAVAAVARYLLEVSDHLTNKGLRHVLRSAVGDRSNEVMMTIGQKLIARGERRGREKGFEEGRDKATRDLLVAMLVDRFGELPSAVAERVNAAPAAELRRWTHRLLRAETLADVFADEH